MPSERLFPIMVEPRGHQIEASRKNGDCAIVVAIPWAMIAPHEAQAQKNHAQSLERLAERGGLTTYEALAVLEGRSWPQRPADHATDSRKLLAMLIEWKGSTNWKLLAMTLGKEEAECVLVPKEPTPETIESVQRFMQEHHGDCTLVWARHVYMSVTGFA